MVSGPRIQLYLIGRFDPWGFFSLFCDPINCTYDEAVAICIKENKDREPWDRIRVFRPPVTLPPETRLLESVQNFTVRRCYPDDRETVEKCLDISSRCLREHGLKMKRSQLFDDLFQLCGCKQTVHLHYYITIVDTETVICIISLGPTSNFFQCSTGRSIKQRATYRLFSAAGNSHLRRISDSTIALH
jgi:hypothetical protein